MKYIDLPIDKRRYEAIGSLLISIREGVAKRILAEFPSARIDTRGSLDDFPASFKRTLFATIVEAKGSVKEPIERVFINIERIEEKT